MYERKWEYEIFEPDDFKYTLGTTNARSFLVHYTVKEGSQSVEFPNYVNLHSWETGEPSVTI